MIKNYFKDVVGYEGLYMVNPSGDIITLRNKNGRRGTKLKPYKDVDGYMRVRLYDRYGESKWLGVHKVVAMTFIPNPRNCISINHINYIRDDNRVDNLEWCNSYYNNTYNNKHTRVGEIQAKPVYQLNDKGELIKLWKSGSEAAKSLGICRSGIRNACCFVEGYNKYKGYIWSYTPNSISRNKVKFNKIKIIIN